MAELWLPAEDRLMVWEPIGDQVRVIGWRPGPAGVSALELVEGLVVVVDHAQPTTLAEVALDLRGGRVDDTHLPLLASLLGDEAVDRLRRAPGSDAGRRPAPLPRPVADDDRYQLSRLDPLRATPAATTFAELMVAADLGDDGHRRDDARAVACLEAADRARSLELPRLVQDFAVRAVDLLETVAPAFDPKFTARLATLAGRVERGVDRITGARLHRATDPRRAEASFPAAASMAPPAAPLVERASAPAARAGAGTDELASAASVPATVSLAVDGDRRAWAGLAHAGHVVVTAGPDAEGTWARVFHRAGRVLLGLAPLLPSPGTRRFEATVVVPRTPTDDLVVDVVVDPATPRRQPTHDAIREAVLAGRAAARLTRLRHPGADAAWAETAERWRRLGDTQRANLAERHGRRDDRRPGGSRRFAELPRLISDELGPPW